MGKRWKRGRREGEKGQREGGRKGERAGFRKLQKYYNIASTYQAAKPRKSTV